MNGDEFPPGLGCLPHGEPIPPWMTYSITTGKRFWFWEHLLSIGSGLISYPRDSELNGAQFIHWIVIYPLISERYYGYCYSPFEQRVLFATAEHMKQ